MRDSVSKQGIIELLRSMIDKSLRKNDLLYHTYAIRNCVINDCIGVIEGYKESEEGWWEHKGEGIYCSVCGAESGYNAWGASAFSTFCPSCGSRIGKKKFELAPCPYCGGDIEVVRSEESSCYQVKCKSCNIASSFEADSTEEAVEFWNSKFSKKEIPFCDI